MTISQQRNGILLLLLAFLFVSLFFGREHVSRALRCVDHTAGQHLCQSLDDGAIASLDIDDDTTDSHEAPGPEFMVQSTALMSSMTLGTGRLHPPIFDVVLPFVYLPLFVPPKIRA